MFGSGTPWLLPHRIVSAHRIPVTLTAGSTVGKELARLRKRKLRQQLKPNSKCQRLKEAKQGSLSEVSPLTDSVQHKHRRPTPQINGGSGPVHSRVKTTTLHLYTASMKVKGQWINLWPLIPVHTVSNGYLTHLPHYMGFVINKCYLDLS